MNNQWSRIHWLIDQQRYEKAVEAVNEFLAKEPQSSKAYSLLSLCYRCQGNLDAALVAAKRGVALAPDSAFAYFHLAWSYYVLDKLDEMAQATRSALSLAPESADLYELEARYWARQRKPKKMLESISRGLQHSPEHIPCLLLEIRALIDLDRLDQATVAIETVLRLDPENATAYAARGWVFYSRTNHKAAIASFREALRLMPDDAWAKRGLMTALGTHNPLNHILFLNPYGRSLFTAAQLRANGWRIASYLVILVCAGWASATSIENLSFLIGIAGSFLLAYLLGEMWCARRSERRNKYILTIVLSLLAMASFSFASKLPQLIVVGLGLGVLTCISHRDFNELTQKMRKLFRGVVATDIAGIFILLFSTAHMLSFIGFAGNVLVCLALLCFILLEISLLEP